LGYSILSKYECKAPHLKIYVLGKLSHVTGHVPATFGLVGTKLSSPEAHPSFPIMVGPKTPHFCPWYNTVLLGSDIGFLLYPLFPEQERE
jgi:hypothetical protein